MHQNTEIIRGLYSAFAKGDIPTVLGALAPNATGLRPQVAPMAAHLLAPMRYLRMSS